KCYIAGSPLLGADGPWGEYWTELGNRLVQKRIFDRVVLVSSAIGATFVGQWQVGGLPGGEVEVMPGFRMPVANPNLNAMLMNVLTQLRPYYRVTQVLWHQGESDGKTSAEDYTRSFMSLVGSLRQRGLSAPIYVSVTSAEPAANLPNAQ